MSVQPCWSAWSDEECANFIAYTGYEGSVSQLRQDVLDLLASRRAQSPAMKALMDAAYNEIKYHNEHTYDELSKALSAAEKELGQ